jgi:hypothetical protein
VTGDNSNGSASYREGLGENIDERFVSRAFDWRSRQSNLERVTVHPHDLVSRRAWLHVHVQTNATVSFVDAKRSFIRRSQRALSIRSRGDSE